MKKKSVRHLTLVLLLFFAVQYCLATEIMIEEAKGNKTGQEVITTYDSFWEPLKNLDFFYLDQNQSALNEEQKLFYQGFSSLCVGEMGRSENIFFTLGQTASDSAIKEEAQRLLYKIWFQQSAWEEILRSEKHPNLRDCSLRREYAVYAETYSQYAPEEYILKSESVIPLKFTFLSGHPVVEVKISNKKYRFALSTGSPLTIISSRLVKNLDLETSGPVSITNDAQKEIKTQMAVVDLTIGKFEMLNHPVVVMDKKQLEYGLIKFDGMLGWKALKNIPMVFDGQNKRVEIRKARPDEILSERNYIWCGDSLPVVLLSNKKGVPCVFALNTFFNNSSIFEGIMDKVDSSGVFTKRVKTVTLGSGRKEEVMVLPELVLHLERAVLHFEEIKTTGVFKSFVNLDGLFGYDLIKAGVVYMDYANGVFCVKKGRRSR